MKGKLFIILQTNISIIYMPAVMLKLKKNNFKRQTSYICQGSDLSKTQYEYFHASTKVLATGVDRLPYDDSYLLIPVIFSPW